MLTIALHPEIETRIAELAQIRGLSNAELVRALIRDGLDDLDDIELAGDRLSSPLPPTTSAQARQILGLDDRL